MIVLLKFNDHGINFKPDSSKFIIPQIIEKKYEKLMMKKENLAMLGGRPQL